jgi:hypothetical protein
MTSSRIYPPPQNALLVCICSGPETRETYGTRSTGTERQQSIRYYRAPEEQLVADEMRMVFVHVLGVVVESLVL